MDFSWTSLDDRRGTSIVNAGMIIWRERKDHQQQSMHIHCVLAMILVLALDEFLGFDSQPPTKVM